MVVVVGVGLHEAVLAPAQDGLAADAVGLDNSRQSHPALPQSIVALFIDTSRGCSRRSCCGSDGPAGAEAALVQDGGDLGFRVLCEQAVDLRDRLRGVSQLFHAGNGVAAKHSVSRRAKSHMHGDGLLAFDQSDVLDEEP